MTTVSEHGVSLSIPKLGHGGRGALWTGQDGTHIRLHRHLRQINLVRQMLVRHAILAPAGPLAGFDHLDQARDVPVVSHLQVHAEAPVEGRARAVDVQVGQPDLDDARELVARLLVVRDPHPVLVLVGDEGPDRERHGREVRGRELVELVALARVHVF